MARPYRPNWERLRLDYFQSRSPYRLWKFALSFALPGLAGGWIALEASRGSQQIYTSGAMSKVHVQWTHQCSRCHEGSFTRLKFWSDGLKDRMAMNEACLHCHGATIGHDRNTKVAWHQASGLDDTACSNCHAEHQGNLDLKDVPDRRCTDCHQSLTRKKETGELKFELDFASFAKHPELRFRRKNELDHGRIEFNHERHFRYVHEDDFESKYLLSPDERLTCSDCHRAGQAGAAWRFSGPGGVHESKRMAATLSEPELQQAYMGTIRYSLHCAKCHSLELPLWRSELSGIKGLLEAGYVPHDTTAAIRTYLRGQFAEYLLNPARKEPPLPRKPVKLSDDADPREDELRKLEWIDGEIEFVEQTLYHETESTCRECHQMNADDDLLQMNADADLPPPSIVPPQIPMRWLLHASFDHAQHKSIVDERFGGPEVPPGILSADVACLKCHGDAIASVKTSDILLPGIEKCRECHGQLSGSATASAGVSDTCTTCHTYHRAPRSHVPSTNLARKAGE